MGNIILTSGPSFSIEEENLKAIKLENVSLVNELKKSIKKYDNLLFISSDPNDYSKTEQYAKIIEKSLSLAGIKFEMSDIIDSRNWLFTKGLVKNSDLIILLGGDPITQMEFFNNIELKDKIKKVDGCVMGISAGSINMASYVYCSKDANIEQSVYYRGLGLTSINVEPHFDITNESRINDILLDDSKEREFIGLPNDSFIAIDEKEIKLYGDAYYFKDGSYSKIENIMDILGDKK